jgi:dienelactone hydrolase
MAALAGAAAALAALVLLAGPAPARADMASLKAACSVRDAADGDPDSGPSAPFTFCDDGIPEAGGTTPNPGADRALPVPQSYEGFLGLPPKAPAEPGTGADDNGDVALDADLSVPHATGGAELPLMILMHTCCSADKRNFEAQTIDAEGELWHYSNAWFASRGYAVLNYTSRGFVDANGRGSTGETQVDSRRHEVNDLQQLACLVAAEDDLDPLQPGDQRVDPRRVVVSGGSYGGGLAWLALTDPDWSCAAAGRPGIRMRLAVAAPRYGWSDLLYALVPNGSHARDALPPADVAGASTKSPFGVPRSSIVTALFVTGRAGDPRTGGRTTFPPELDRAIACLSSATPLEENPLCTATGVIPELTDGFLADRSSYYQDTFFARLRQGTVDPVPVFSAGSLSSPLFGQVDHRRMVDLLRAADPDYPVQEYYGDIGDFTQNKTKEWADTASRVGIATRLNSFVDHYARPPGRPPPPAPAFDVTVALQTCPPNAADPFPADEPGERYTESTFGALAPEHLVLSAEGTRTTTSDAEPNPHAANADPIANFIQNGGRCPVERNDAGPGVAVYDLGPLESDAVTIGRGRVTVPHTGSGTDLQLAARLYELMPDGSQVLVDRGVTRLAAPNGTTTFDLQGNGWRFTSGNRLRLELAQDDEPYVKASTRPSSLTLSGVTLDLPVRRLGPDAEVHAPELASDVATGGRFPVRVGARSGETTGVAATRALVSDTAAPGSRPLRGSSFRGRGGRTYRIEARLVDRAGAAGEPATALTVVPIDDRPGHQVRYRGRWRRVEHPRAWRGGFSRASRRGARLSLRLFGDRVYLVGRTVPGGGRALVTVGRRREVVSFRSDRTVNRRVLLRLALSPRADREMRLTVLRGPVQVDAIGVRRP